MKRNLKHILVLLVLPALLAFSQSVEYTKRSKNEVREGPGSYFRLVAVLPKGVAVTVVKRQEGWANIFLGEKIPQRDFVDAWMSKNCLIDKKPNTALRDLNIEWQSSKASPSSVAAAIRGFAVRYGRTKAPAVDALLRDQQQISPEEYLRFKQETRPSAPVKQKALPAEEVLLTDYDVTLAEEGVGLGIAARVAADGLVKDPKLLRYVNLIATLLIESSGAYDTPIRVYISKSESINAVSVPGGYIFITKKMLDMCHDEAELAAVIAHEMIHVLYHHGVKEIHQRLSNIKMDEAMNELDAEIGEQPGEVIQELEDFASEAYENVHKPRLLSYEVEADRGGAFLLAATGYDPMGMGRMLLAMREVVGKSSDINKEDPFLQRDVQRRYDKLVALIQKSMPDVKGVTNVERFRRNMGR